MTHDRGHARSPESGFTLLEIIVVLAVIGLVMGSAVRGFRSLVKSDLRAGAAQVSGMMRFLFDRASTTGRMHRLVIDLAQNQVWAEMSDDRYFIPRERETDLSREMDAEKEKKRDDAEKKQQESMAASPAAAAQLQLMPQAFEPKRARFASFKETKLRPVALKTVKLIDVYTPRLAEPITKGRAYIYFFPMGQTEPAMIHLGDKKGELVYTLVVHPLTGRVRIYNEDLKPQLEERYDDEGNRIEQ